MACVGWSMRRFCTLALPLMLMCTGCSDTKAPASPPTNHKEPDRTAGEMRATIAPKGEVPAVARSGPKVPITLPKGFTLYPNAKVVANTVVKRGDSQRTLLAFETDDPVPEVIAFYRRQISAAGVRPNLDVGGEDRASLGGELSGGGTFSLTARRDRRTRVELAFD